MIRATSNDAAEITAFLTPVSEYAMFPLNNLARYGMEGGHPNAITIWTARQDGKITDVLAQNEAGMVMPYLPSHDYHKAAKVLRGREVSGMVGVKDWVRGLERATGLQGQRALDADEAHFLLNIADLTVPPGPGRIVPLAEAPEQVIRAWMLDYQLTALCTPSDQAPQRVDSSYATYISLNSHVVLMDGNQPLAMTGFNAQLPDIVQVGGVYTPPALRGQGHARRAVALHLAQSSAARATLFSASEIAARAYRAIGFRQIGDWTLLLLANQVRLG